jgi:hypothetical protein
MTRLTLGKAETEVKLSSPFFLCIWPSNEKRDVQPYPVKRDEKPGL